MIWSRWKGEVDFASLLGVTLTTVKRATIGGEESLYFEATDGRRLGMWHEQDCCESVWIEDICGDLGDLIGSPLVEASETSNHEEDGDDFDSRSRTWTFYRLATVRGTVTIRWCGQSNGRYSESAQLYDISHEDAPRPDETEGAA